MSISVEQWVTLFNWGHNPSDEQARYRRQTVRQFWQAYSRGKWRTWLERLGGHDVELQDMAKALKGARVKSRHYLGSQSVPMDRIRGSEGRRHDFVDEFNPLVLHTKDHWNDMAIAQLLGLALPPVDLIRRKDG